MCSWRRGRSRWTVIPWSLMSCERPSCWQRRPTPASRTHSWPTWSTGFRGNPFNTLSETPIDLSVSKLSTGVSFMSLAVSPQAGRLPPPPSDRLAAPALLSRALPLTHHGHVGDQGSSLKTSWKHLTACFICGGVNKACKNTELQTLSGALRSFFFFS